jgi:hypothetical protein
MFGNQFTALLHQAPTRLGPHHSCRVFGVAPPSAYPVSYALREQIMSSREVQGKEGRELTAAAKTFTTIGGDRVILVYFAAAWFGLDRMLVLVNLSICLSLFSQRFWFIPALLLWIRPYLGIMRNQVVTFLVWLWWIIDLAIFEFESGIVSFCFSFIFASFGCTRIGDLMQRTRDGRTDRVLGGRAIKRSGDIVCGLHHARGDEKRWVVWPQNHSDGFRRFGLKTSGDGFSSVWASKPMVTVSSGLTSKPAVTVFSSLASTPVAMVFSSLASKLVVTISPGLTSKPVVIFLIEPQNQGGEGFPDLGLKTSSFNLMI